MAMIKCPECGTEISTRAAACVNCGLPMSEIYICSECGNVGIRNENICTKCGCPLETTVQNSKKSTVIKEVNPIPEKSVSEEDVIISVFNKVISQMPTAENFKHYFISGGGEPLESLSDEQNARNVFSIPNNVRVYFVTSGNVFGGIKIGSKGFAITPEGIYYTDSKKRRGIINIYEFMESQLKCTPYISIGSHEFNATNTEKLLRMLKNLQNELINALE